MTIPDTSAIFFTQQRFDRRRRSSAPPGVARTRLMRVSTITLLALVVPFCGLAHADCAAGDGVLTSPGTCTVPQILTGSAGVISNGAILTTGTDTTAYTVSSNNAVVTNSGVVNSEGSQAIKINGLGVVTITNSGTISVSQGSAITTGGFLSTDSRPSGVSGTVNITNTGNIAGSDVQFIVTGNVLTSVTGGAIRIAGGTITQAGGIIQGGLLIAGATTVNVTGGAINGPIFDRASASGSAGSSQGRFGLVNFDLGAGSFTTNGNIEVGTVNVKSGTLVLQNDVYVSGGIAGPGLTNNGTLQISGFRTLTGSFVQNPSGTLMMQVNPQGSSQLILQRLPFFGGRTASLAGTLALAYQPGTYRPRSYTLISADTSGLVTTTGEPPKLITGSFSQITGVVPTVGLGQSIVIGPTEVELILSGGSVSPTDTAILSAIPSAVVLNGQRMTGILLDRLGNRLGGIADGSISAADAAPVRLAQASDMAALALSATPAASGAWFRGIGDFLSLRGHGAMPGFDGSAGGFLTGFDRAVAPDLSLGVAGGFVHSDLTQHPAGSGQIDSARFAVYGGGRIGPNLLTGTAGYAYDRLSTGRSLASVGTAREGHNGHELAMAAQWSRPMAITGIAGAAVVTPKIGVQFLHLFEDGFRETGVSPGFGLTSSGNDTDSVQPYIGIAASEKFVMYDGAEVTPEIRLGYSRELADNRRLVNVAASDGTPFVVTGVRPSRDMLTAGIGATLRAQDSILFYANYDALIRTGNTSEHTVSAGLRIRF